MIRKKSIIKITIFAVLLLLILLLVKLAFAQNCPYNTEAQETTATLVGEVTDDGGDSNLEVWFQYGLSSSYGYETSHQSKYGTGLFCSTIYNLDPSTTYHYRAVAKNSAGVSYGEDKTFTTLSSQTPGVDLKANGSDGPITLNYKNYVNLSWNSSNAVSCWASGDWSGSKYTSGFESIQLNSVKTYTFSITCQNSNNSQTASDSVQVIVQPNLPTVITKPAIVTY